jgi:hypothetical protein
MTGIVNRLLEKMLGENRKEIPCIDVEEKFFLGKTKVTNNAYGYFRGCDRANWTSIDMKGQKQTKGHKPGRNVILLRSFHDIVSSKDREVNQDTGSKSTKRTQQGVSLAISTTIARRLWRTDARVWKTDSRTNTRARASLDGRVGAEHANSRAKLGSTERDHVLSDVLSNNLTMLRVGVSENVLDEVVAVLVAGDVDQWNARTIETTLTDTVKIATEEVNTTNLEALLNDLRRKLVHAVLRGIADDMVDSSAAISWGTVLADVLDAPVAKLAMSNDVDACQDLLNARALEIC